MNLHACLLEPQQSRSRASLRQWQHELRLLISNQVDFRAPPLKAIADFLLYLFQDRKLRPGTIDGYRSAIANKLGNFLSAKMKISLVSRLISTETDLRARGASPPVTSPWFYTSWQRLPHLHTWLSRLFSCWSWVLVNAGVRSMLGYIRTSDTSQTGLRCICTPHPAFYPRTSWLRAQIV